MTSVLTLYPSLIPVHSIEQIWIGNEDLAYDGQMLFIKKIVIKLDLNMSGTKVRDYLLSVQRQLIEDERFRSLVVYYDVDPT